MDIILNYEEIREAISRFLGRRVDGLSISVGRNGNNRATATATINDPALSLANDTNTEETALPYTGIEVARQELRQNAYWEPTPPTEEVRETYPLDIPL